MKSRIIYLDNAKGLLIVSVVLGHLFQTSFLSKFIYNFHMMAFFFIAGILFQLTHADSRPFKNLFCKKFLTYSVPFVFFEILVLVKQLIVDPAHLNLKAFLYHTLTLSFNNGDLWFLFTLFWAELLLWGLCKCFKSNLLRFMASLLFLALSLLIQPICPVLDYLRRVLRSMIFLVSGSWYQQNNQSFKTKRLFKKIPLTVPDFCLLSFFLLLVFTIHHDAIGFTNVTFSNCLFWLIGSALGCFLILSAAHLRWGRWCSFFGENSLVIFGTHHILFSVIGKPFGVTDFFKTPVYEGIIIFLILMVFEACFIWFINKYAPFLIGKFRLKKQEKTQ